MQKDCQSSTPEKGEDMAGGNDQNVLEETVGSISVEESAVEQGLGFYCVSLKGGLSYHVKCRMFLSYFIGTLCSCTSCLLEVDIDIACDGSSLKCMYLGFVRGSRASSYPLSTIAQRHMHTKYLQRMARISKVKLHSMMALCRANMHGVL